MVFFIQGIILGAHTNRLQTQRLQLFVFFKQLIFAVNNWPSDLIFTFLESSFPNLQLLNS